MELDKSKFEKLPKWAQNYITNLERERKEAVTALLEFMGHNDVGAFVHHKLACIGPDRAPTSLKMRVDSHYCEVTHLGVRLSITLAESEFRLSWSTDGSVARIVAFVPVSFQACHLIAKEHMW